MKLAQWRGSDVVVKKLKVAEFSPELFISFVNEAATSEQLAKHPNVVPFVGICPETEMAMVYQFMPG